jgi:hypothetical protein
MLDKEVMPRVCDHCDNQACKMFSCVNDQRDADLKFLEAEKRDWYNRTIGNDEAMLKREHAKQKAERKKWATETVNDLTAILKSLDYLSSGVDIAVRIKDYIAELRSETPGTIGDIYNKFGAP